MQDKEFTGHGSKLIVPKSEDFINDPRIHLVLACDFDTYARYRMFKKLTGTTCQRLMMEHQLVNYHTPLNAKVVLVQPGYKDNRIWKDGGIARWVVRANAMALPQASTEEFYFPAGIITL